MRTAVEPDMAALACFTHSRRYSAISLDTLFIPP